MVKITTETSTKTNQPILWKPIEIPISNGYKEAHLVIKFTSSCSLLTEKIMHKDILHQAKTRCEEIYQSTYMDSIEQMCPAGTFTELESRFKRFIFTTSIIIGTFIAALTVTTVSAAAVAMTDISTNGPSDVEYEMKKFEDRQFTTEAQNEFFGRVLGGI